MDNGLELLFAVVLMSAALAYVTYIFRITTRRQRERAQQAGNQATFHEALSVGLTSGSVSSLEDLLNLHRGLTGAHTDDSSYRHTVSVQLREFLAALISRRVAADLDDQTLREWKDRVTAFLRANEDASPYADLPPAERSILTDLSALVRAGDKDSAARKVAELVGMIQARHDDLVRIQSINRYTLPVSIITTVTTVALAFMRLV